MNKLVPCAIHSPVIHIRKTRLFKYIENFTTKNWKFSDKNSDIFHISAQNIDCGYSLEPPRRGGFNEYPQSMFLSRNKENNVYPCKPKLYYIKVRFKGGQNYIGMFSWWNNGVHKMCCFLFIPTRQAGDSGGVYVLWFPLEVCLSAVRPSVYLFPDDNLSKISVNFHRTCMCIEIVKIWFGISYRQFCQYLTELSAHTHVHIFVSAW